jgi:hypothetical protein
MDDNKEEKKKWNNDLIAILTIVIGVLLIFILPYVLTNYSIGLDFGNPESNSIGDTIGGITTPIIGLVSAVLVYLALKAQIKANEIIQCQIIKAENLRVEEEILNVAISLMDQIREELKSVDKQTELKPNRSKVNFICEGVIGMNYSVSNFDQNLIKNLLIKMQESFELVIRNVSNENKIIRFYLNSRPIIESYFSAPWLNWSGAIKREFDYEKCKDLDFLFYYYSVSSNLVTLYSKISKKSIHERNWASLDIVKVETTRFENLRNEYNKLVINRSE